MSFSDNNLAEFGNFRFDFDERTLWFENKPVALAPKVAETLCLLIENQGRLMTKDDLMNAIWADTFVEEKNLTQNISTLRKIFREKQKGFKFIETVPKRGYRFVADVRPVIEGKPIVSEAKEEFFAVRETQKASITVEGFVTREELDETVREIAQRVMSAENPAEPEKLVVRKSEKNPIFSFTKIIAAAAVFLALVGTGIWLWQNDFSTFRKSSSFNTSRTILDFQRLTESGNAFFPAISPDKKFVAYVVSEKGLYQIVLQNIETGSTTEIVAPQNFEMRSPQFSADGNYLFYAARDGQQESTVYKTPIFGGSPQQIVTNINQNFSISPDGEHLAFFRYHPPTKDRHLIVSRADGSDEKIVATGDEKSVFQVWETAPAWSSDGQKLVVSVINKIENKKPHSYFVEINLADGDKKRLNAPDWKMAHQAYWMADGSGLIALVQANADEKFQLRHLAYPSGEARPITNDNNNYTEFRLAPDDEFIITTEQRQPFNLQLIPVENSQDIVKLTDSTATKRGYMGLDWSPNGEEIVFVQIEGLFAGNIWKMNVETQEMTQLTFDESVSNQFPSVAPDGNFVVFSSNRSGVRHIWQIDFDGTNLRQITDGSGEQHPQISADGKWLIYTENKAMWKKPFDGGEAVKLLDNAAPGDISSDMKYIAASFYDESETKENQWKQILVPFTKNNFGEPKIMSFVSARLHAVRWNNEDDGIYFLSTGETVTNIQFYSLVDKSIRQITEFDSQQIHDISLSPDGKFIAAGRGEKTSNIYKIGGF